MKNKRIKTIIALAMIAAAVATGCSSNGSQRLKALLQLQAQQQNPARKQQVLQAQQIHQLLSIKYLLNQLFMMIRNTKSVISLKNQR